MENAQFFLLKENQIEFLISSIYNWRIEQIHSHKENGIFDVVLEDIHLLSCIAVLIQMEQNTAIDTCVLVAVRLRRFLSIIHTDFHNEHY